MLYTSFRTVLRTIHVTIGHAQPVVSCQILTNQGFECGFGLSGRVGNLAITRMLTMNRPNHEILTVLTFCTKPLSTVDGRHSIVNSRKRRRGKRKPLPACPMRRLLVKHTFSTLKLCQTYVAYDFKLLPGTDLTV